MNARTLSSAGPFERGEDAIRGGTIEEGAIEPARRRNPGWR
jgi:hypothetical protein